MMNKQDANDFLSRLPGTLWGDIGIEMDKRNEPIPPYEPPLPPEPVYVYPFDHPEPPPKKESVVRKKRVGKMVKTKMTMWDVFTVGLSAVILLVVLLASIEQGSGAISRTYDWSKEFIEFIKISMNDRENSPDVKISSKTLERKIRRIDREKTKGRD